MTTGVAVVPVILCGGVGSRLWPVSREAYPKPFIRLGNGTSLLQQVYARARALPGAGGILTVTNAEYYFAARDELAGAGAEAGAGFLLEPAARNTAGAIALAALAAEQRAGPDAVLLVLPSDHLVTGADEFGRAVAAAERLARRGHLVTFGIRPTAPETAYGYIEQGAPLDGDGFAVARFVEKPGREQAAALVASGRHFWNAGMFCFTAGRLLAGLGEHAPAVLAAARAAWSAVPDGAAEVVRFDPGRFAQLPDISIDYALMEKARNVAVVPASFGWSDVGSWTAVSELYPADEHGNRVVGEAVAVDSHGCFIQSADRIVATVGVDDLLIVDTPDALLVAQKDKAQQVREVTERLKLSGHPAHKIHRTVVRPWGSYTLLEQGPGYKIKRIVVNPGAALSLQLHRRRSEHWVVISGRASVVNGERELFVAENESTFIPAHTRHRLANPGADPLVIIEVQTGEYVEEDDIVRFDDVYGRR